MRALPWPDDPRSDASDDASDPHAQRTEALSPVAALAHDLRSPLAAVLGFARLAREDLNAGHVSRAALLLDRLERSAAMLETMLGNALNARLSPGPARGSLRSALEQVHAERKRELEQRGIQLLVLGLGDAPLLSVRPSDLYRVVSNLVGNAVDHMGDVRDATIAVSLCCEAELATLRVSDNGVGIAPERRERVFEAAHSQCGDDARRCHRGFGLAIVRELAASWGGRAWVEASRGRGATLCVTIPVAR